MRHSIFYFDDEPVAVRIFAETFSHDYEISTATTLFEARRALSESAFDLIISAQDMPEIDGTEFLREAALLFPRSVRVLLSRDVPVGNIVGEAGMGLVNIFVPKPWSQEQMRAVLERALAALDVPDSHGGADGGERRIAPRHEVKLEMRVLLIAEGGRGDILPLTGYTRDVSESGIGLVVTREDGEALASLGMDYMLYLMLAIPSGHVELTVTPARCERLGTEQDAGFMIGAQITDMSGRDRVRFMEYIRGLTDRT